MISKLSPISSESYLPVEPPGAIQSRSKAPKSAQEYTAFDDAVRRTGQEAFGVDDDVAAVRAEDVIQQDASGQDVQSSDIVDEPDVSMTSTEEEQSVESNSLGEIDFVEMPEATDQMSVVHAVSAPQQADGGTLGGTGGTLQNAAQVPVGAGGSEASVFSGTGVRLASGQSGGATASTDPDLNAAYSVLRMSSEQGQEGAGTVPAKSVVELATTSGPLAISAKEHALQRVWKLPERSESAAETLGATPEEALLTGDTVPRQTDTLGAMGAQAGLDGTVVMQTSAQMSVAIRSEREMSLKGSVSEENGSTAQVGLDGLNQAGDRVVVSTTSTATTPHAIRADASQIVGQMSASIRRNGLGQTEVALNPPELGSLKISLESRDSGMVVSISADKPETMDLIRRHIDQLEQDLIEMGYSSLTFDFASSGEQASGDAGESPQDGGTGTMMSGEDAPAEVPLIGAGPRQGASGVDIRL